MNCMFTVNVGDFVTEYSRRSFRSACDRWKCDYAELCHHTLAGYPSTAKWFGADKFQGFRCLLFVDGDCVISPDAPNPFELCTEDDALYAVTDLQAGNPNDLWRESVYRGPIRNILKEHPEWTIHPEELAFNAGVMLFRPTAAIRKMFQTAREIFPVNWTGYQEQSTLNLIRHNSAGVSLKLLPEKWNHMVLVENEPVTGNYINHYGGSARVFLKKMA